MFNVKENSQWDFFSSSELNESSNQNSKSIAYFDSSKDEVHQRSYHLMLESFVKRGFRVASINQSTLGKVDLFESEIDCCSNLLKTDSNLNKFLMIKSGVHYLSLKNSEIFTALYSKQDFITDLISDLKSSYDIVFVKMENRLIMHEGRFVQKFDQVILCSGTEKNQTNEAYSLFKQINKSSLKQDLFWLFRSNDSFSKVQSIFNPFQKTLNKFFGSELNSLGYVSEKQGDIKLGAPYINKEFSRVIDLYLQNTSVKKSVLDRKSGAEKIRERGVPTCQQLQKS